MPFITNTTSGNFLTDGPYVYEQPTQPVLPLGPQTNLLGGVGCATDGTPNLAQYFTNPGSDGAAIFGTELPYGSLTPVPNGLMQEALLASPECSAFVGVRVTDGTDTAATIAWKDASAGTVFTLTRQCTGSNANNAFATLALQSGTASAAPVYSLQINYPNVNPEIYTGLVASSGGGAYSATVFQASLAKALAVSPRWTYTAGASVLAPQVTTTTQATGGTDGITTITDATLIGTDGTTARKGMYALRGLLSAAQFYLAQIDTSVASTIDAFCQQENCISAVALATATPTATAITTKIANNASTPNLLCLMDWIEWYDPQLATQRVVSPIGKSLGIVSSVPPYQYIGQKPLRGAAGIVGTDRTSLPLSFAEAGLRQVNHINYLTNNPQVFFQTGYGFPHGLMSDGSRSSDVRMLKYIGAQLQAILGQFVAQMQSTNANDATRKQAKASVNGFMQTLLTPVQQISTYEDILDTTNNTPTSIAQGFLICNLLVTTLTPAQFVLGLVQVGSQVQIAVQSAQA